MDGRFHYMAKLRQLSLLAVLLVSCLVPMTTATAKCYNPGAIASRFEEQLREEQALTAKTAYTGVFDPGQKVQIGLLRWYDPNLQRWISRDPMGEFGGLNLYRFNHNSPQNWVDADGFTPVGAGIGGAIGGGIGAFFGGGLGFIGGTIALPGIGSIAVGVTGEQAGAAAGIAAGAVVGDWISNWFNKPAPTVCPTQINMTPDQRAVKDLADEATLGGRKPLPRDDAETILDWADETGYPGWRAKAGDVSSPSNWGANPTPHIHLPGAGRSGHVPVQPGVQPR